MDEQLLKDFIATAQKYNYDYDVVMPKFPELEGYDLQLLKDYIATAEKDQYDYAVTNAKFPELFAQDVKKKEDAEGMASTLDVGSSELSPIEQRRAEEEQRAVDFAAKQRGDQQVRQALPDRHATRRCRVENGQW